MLCENNGHLIFSSCFRQLNFFIHHLFNRICRSSSEADKSKLEFDSDFALFWEHYSTKYKVFIFLFSLNIYTLLKSLLTMQEISWEIEENKREKILFVKYRTVYNYFSFSSLLKLPFFSRYPTIHNNSSLLHKFLTSRANFKVEISTKVPGRIFIKQVWPWN